MRDDEDEDSMQEDGGGGRRQEIPGGSFPATKIITFPPYSDFGAN
jgi:hypothetical protein